LVISSFYPTEDGSITKSIFVKNQVDELKKYFKKIIVIAPIPFFPKFLQNLNSIPLDYRVLPKFFDYSYENVSVFFPKYISSPIFKKITDFSLLKTVENCIQRNKLSFDLIHAHFLFPSGLVAAKLKKKYGFSVVTTAHGSDIYLTPFTNSVFRQRAVFALENADKIITVSKSNLKCIRRLGIRKRVFLIPNGFNHNLFYPKNKDYCQKKLGIKGSNKVILNVGRLREVKNHKTLILALSKLRNKRKDFVCYIVSGGPLENQLKSMIKSYKLNKFVRIVGQKQHDEIPLWMNAADLFVLPSYRESFGIVNIEALACGTPVVSTVNGGSESILVNKDYGLLLKNPEDYEGLAALINEALNKKWNKKKITDYSEKFALEKIAKKTLSIYKNIL
ncbi:MAG: glycosyltransferase family 4 protein, partial [Candidatus Muiribacteriota bacterium]